jgi:hypothetical protein
VTRIDYYPAGEIFLILTQAYFAMVALGHLGYNSGTNFVGPISANTLKDYPSARTFKTFKHLPLDSRLWLPFEVHFILAGSRPKLNYSDSRSKALVQPAKREACVQYD